MEYLSTPREKALAEEASSLLDIESKFITAQICSSPTGHFSHVDIIIKVPTERSVNKMGEILKRMIKKS